MQLFVTIIAKVSVVLYSVNLCEILFTFCSI